MLGIISGSQRKEKKRKRKKNWKDLRWKLGFIAQRIDLRYRSVNRLRRVLFKEKIIDSFEDGKRVVSSIPEAAKESWMKGWLIGSGRPFTSGIVESKQTGQIEREKEKRTMERRAADIGATIFALVKRSRRSGTESPSKVCEFFPESPLVLIFFCFWNSSHNLERHNRCFLAICCTVSLKLANDKEKVHRTRFDEHSSEFVSFRRNEWICPLFFSFFRS